jgi:mono/diheme cytochrome c family protein
MRWPFGTQTALLAWRTLFFSPQDFQPDAAQSPAWNRGAYLVNTLGHCGECHTPRNRLGAAQADLAWQGGLIPMQGWLAPSLLSSSAAGTDAQRLNDTLQLLKTGHSSHATASGPMAMVVQASTQYLTEPDLQAMGVYLQSLTQARERNQSEVATGHIAVASRLAPAAMARATSLYTSHCAACHGQQGQGVPGAYPALAGNRAVLLAESGNLIQTTLHGGFAPVTRTTPKPYGMPPFMLTLSDGDIALVLSYIRQAWGNQAAPVTESDVSRLRENQASR